MGGERKGTRKRVMLVRFGARLNENARCDENAEDTGWELMSIRISLFVGKK
jgi:hypothetical protein